MNASKAGTVVLIMGGVGLVYLAVTGYAGGVWDALKGPKPDAGAATGSGVAGGVSRALGRGMGGAVSNLPYSYSGYFYPLPSGGVMTSNAGRWGP